MKHWEYKKEVHAVRNPIGREIVEVMNKFGAEGWETFSVTEKVIDSSVTYGEYESWVEYTLMMKREQEVSNNTPNVSTRFSSGDMIAFGNFIRDNYHGIGSPKLISYDHTKYPNGTIEDIFVIWCCEKGY